MTTSKVFFLCFSIFTNTLIVQSQILRKENIDTKKSKVPFFELVDINLKKIKQTDLIGKVVIINFWGINCPPCIAEIPKLNIIVKKFKSENVVFIGICPLTPKRFTMDKYEEIKYFLKKKEFLYRICPVEDFKIFSTKFNLRYAPTHFIIDKSGYIVYKYTGIINEKDFVKLISNELNCNNKKQ